MTEQALPLMTFYKGWGTYQRNLVEVIAPLSPAQLAAPAGAHTWTIGMLIQHMIANRVWWFQLWAGEGSPDLAPITHWDPADPQDTPVLDAAELVAGLESTWHMVSDALNHWTPADLERVLPTPASLSAEEQKMFPPTTLRWLLWHVLEHEIHHGGELSLVLGEHGLPGIYGSM